MQLPNFYALLATVCYLIVSINLWKHNRRILSISFFLLTCLYFSLQSLMLIFVNPELNGFAWGIFNSLNALFILFISNLLMNCEVKK